MEQRLCELARGKWSFKCSNKSAITALQTRFGNLAKNLLDVFFHAGYDVCFQGGVERWVLVL